MRQRSLLLAPLPDNLKLGAPFLASFARSGAASSAHFHLQYLPVVDTDRASLAECVGTKTAPLPELGFSDPHKFPLFATNAKNGAPNFRIEEFQTAERNVGSTSLKRERSLDLGCPMFARFWQTWDLVRRQELRMSQVSSQKALAEPGAPGGAMKTVTAQAAIQRRYFL